MELTFEQTLIVGFVASALVWLLRQLLMQFNVSLSKPVISIVLAVVSILISVLFLWKEVVAVSAADPMEMVAQVSKIASAVVGLAYLIYNILLKKVLETAQIKVIQLLSKPT